MSILNWFIRKKRTPGVAAAPSSGVGVEPSRAQGQGIAPAGADAAKAARRTPDTGAADSAAGDARGHQFNQEIGRAHV